MTVSERSCGPRSECVRTSCANYLPIGVKSIRTNLARHHQGRESGLASEQFCNEFSIDMGRGFYPLYSANITLAALGPGLLMFKCSLDIAEDCWFNAREIITITFRQLRLLRKA